MVALLVVATIITFLTIDYFVQKKESPTGEKWPLLSIPLQPVQALAASLPEWAFVHSGHTWVTVRDNGRVRIGIDGFAADALGRAKAVKLPPVAASVEAGKPAIAVQFDGRVAEFTAPVDGEIVAVNDHLSPDGLGDEWLVEVKPRHFGRDVQKLRTAEVAKEWLERERGRFRDFLASLGGEPALVLQDGGEPLPGVLASIDDQAWARFQDEFLRQ